MWLIPREAFYLVAKFNLYNFRAGFLQLHFMWYDLYAPFIDWYDCQSDIYSQTCAKYLAHVYQPVFIPFIDVSMGNKTRLPGSVVMGYPEDLLFCCDLLQIVGVISWPLHKGHTLHHTFQFSQNIYQKLEPEGNFPGKSLPCTLSSLWVNGLRRRICLGLIHPADLLPWQNFVSLPVFCPFTSCLLPTYLVGVGVLLSVEQEAGAYLLWAPGEQGDWPLRGARPGNVVRETAEGVIAHLSPCWCKKRRKHIIFCKVGLMSIWTFSIVFSWSNMNGHMPKLLWNINVS